MALAEGSTSHKVLLVDDDGAVRDMMTATLEHKGFKVVSAANVTEALKHITTESFDVLLTNCTCRSRRRLHRGYRNALLNRMHLRCWSAVFPDVQSAMAAILLEADEIIVKPFDVGRTR